MQSVVIVGNLGGDPEMRYTANGTAVTQFSVAVSERAGDKEETEWFNVVCWQKLAEVCAEHLAKGRKVGVQGKMRTRSWEAQDGTRRYRTELVANNVEFLSPRSEGAPARGSGPSTPAADADDSLPF